MEKSFKRALFCLLPAVQLVLAAQGGAIEDGIDITYPGANCKFYGTQASDSYLNPSGLSANGLRNTSASSRYVVCPIAQIWDDPSHSGQPHIGQAIGILSTSAGNCQLYRRSFSGTSWDNWSANQITDAGDTWLYDIAPSGNYFPTYGSSTSLYCQLPANAYINNYVVATIHE